MLRFYFKNLTEEQIDKCFNNTLKKYGGWHLLEKYCQDLNEKQRDIAFNNALENDKASYLFYYCFENLTEEQQDRCFNNLTQQDKDIAFKNATKNLSYAFYLLKYHSHKLTGEQIQILKSERLIRNLIKDNLGHYLFANHFNDLTQEQKQLAFDNAIKNNCGKYVKL